MVRTHVIYNYERVKGFCPICDYRTTIKKGSYNIEKVALQTAKHIARKEDKQHKQWKMQHNISLDTDKAWKQLNRIKRILPLK
jgi:uncharacterized Zn finger protein (UPF0148 family)